MARDMTPVLKKCRALGIEPAYLGLNKQSKKKAKVVRKMSEYGMQLKEKQKAKAMTYILSFRLQGRFLQEGIRFLPELCPSKIL